VGRRGQGALARIAVRLDGTLFRTGPGRLGPRRGHGGPACLRPRCGCSGAGGSAARPGRRGHSACPGQLAALVMAPAWPGTRGRGCRAIGTCGSRVGRSPFARGRRRRPRSESRGPSARDGGSPLPWRACRCLLSGRASSSCRCGPGPRACLPGRPPGNRQLPGAWPLPSTCNGVSPWAPWWRLSFRSGPRTWGHGIAKAS